MNDPAAGGRARSGLEHVAIRLERRGYAPHRHDTYTVGLTLSGVQTFDYRGAIQRSLAGNAFVLHPDERHDGRPGTRDGFAHRSLYLSPDLVADALGTRALPFVAEPVLAGSPLAAAIVSALRDYDPVMDGMAATALVQQVADALAAASDARPMPEMTLDLAALGRVRDLLVAAGGGEVPVEVLEAESGLDRWRLYRQFRRRYGLSPHRFLAVRRLMRARALIAGGTDLASAAICSGFADQSHMTRQFVALTGLTPGRWRALRQAGSQAR
ncbi:MAG: AraC family transcriptional regulator [Pseudomonadota bacterium]|nr:AraC family transcriptional regulator [Pseudomonadota bacterium]